jgi:Pyruvate/2-oxoacid:ferredoxin oxidoreductase delta subunit
MKYQSMKIAFMSGTGNSFRVATWIKERAENNNIESELRQIRNNHNKFQNIRQEKSLLGIVFPTYGFTAPWNVIRYCLFLPFGGGQHAFVIATKGALMIESTPFRGYEGTAAYLIVFLLFLKGYKIRGAMGLDMPANMISMHSGLTKEDSLIIIAKARTKSDFFTNRLANGEHAFYGGLDLLLGLLLLPFSIAYFFYARFFLTRLFFASDDCTGCAVCAESCPKKAIKMMGRKKIRPYWKLSCESCMRCMCYCPKKAIEVSHLFAVILIIIILIPLPNQIFLRLNEIAKMDFVYSFSKFIINFLYFLLKISIASFIFSHLIKIPHLNKSISSSALTHFYRRYHEPDTELRDLVEKN